MPSVIKKISFRNIVSLIAITTFLIVAQGQVMPAFAADWELWPKGRGKEATGEPAPKPAPVKPPADKAAEKSGEAAGAAVAAGATGGTVGKIALVGAGILAIGLAIGAGGGGGGGSTTAHH
jgi:hypothetical protein